MQWYDARRTRLGELIETEGLEALLVTHPTNVGYLTGFSGEASYLIVMRKNTLLVSDGRFTDQLAEECPGLETVIRPPTKSLPEATGEALAQLNLRNVGFESHHLSVAEFETFKDRCPTIDWSPARDRVEKLRIRKDDWEIEQIRQAVHYAEKAFAMFRALLRSEDTEKALSDAMESYVRRAGAKNSSFPTIVAVGGRAALPHAPPTNRRVNEASLLLLDWGASGPFYKSDLTRVLFTHNNLPLSQAQASDLSTAKLEEVYGVVLKAQLAALECVRPGVKAGDVDAAARRVIEAAGYGGCFTHSLGHGLGMQVHEAPLVKPGSETVLESGMVITIEPGIYIRDWGGIRIEDDVLVTPDGKEILTHVPKTLAESIVAF